ncbi:DUF1203 domain-containing protein [Roseibium porphyridii]|uniref:DUF1203 domain-containing protein n=1 Tax=Roseibium porphyridii TaxID=2866279 RepID=A0ABY8F9Z3_9HYPH|nr:MULTISPECIES: DUF1203 domain-containing protein [Stappiaceae]QFT29066.1 hypothetical protein FIV00_01085 [Labrenzia sp. THAF82]WFE90065.1 DUF1203 domain-containing protein [Roseibium sp. KMA01]
MFQIHPLPANEFSHLFGLSDAQLAEKKVQVLISDGAFPCRVSLTDVAAGERVLLLNFEHQPGDTPYRSRHAIFVKDDAHEAELEADVIPQSIVSRFLSVRAFNRQHEIIDADVVKGTEVETLIASFFENPDVDYLHLHYAGRGCFAAKVTRAQA